jgi:hypothetical protein
MFALALAALFVALPVIPGYNILSPDAWTVYELAQTVGGDFFRVSTVREYTTGSAYSSAFAPLWPVVVSLFAWITGNIYGSYVAAFLAFAGFAAAAELVARRAFGQRGIGVLSALLVLHFSALQGELSSGRSIPLYLCELALLGALLIGLDAAPKRRAAMVGLLVGAMTMTRFDALPAALVVILGAPFIGVSRARVALIVAGFVLAISPWLAYSLVHFHTVFATDNRAVALALDKSAFILDFHVRPQLTLFDAPLAWLAKFPRHTKDVGLALYLSVRESLFLPVLFLLVMVRASVHRTPLVRPTLDAHARAIALFAAATVAPISGYLVTGYWDHRYYSGCIWLAELFALAYVTRGWERPFAAATFGLAVAGGLFSVAELRHVREANPLAAVHRMLDRSSMDQLTACLRRAGGTPSDGVVFAGRDVVSRFKFGALTGWRALPLPSNWERLGRLERDEFLRRYRAKFVVDSRQPPVTPIGLGAISVECPVPLQKLAPAAP